MSGIGLVVVSPRIPAGLMSREAWRGIENADAVLARDLDQPLAQAVIDSGADVVAVGEISPATLARELANRAASHDVVWLGSADADPGLTDALASELTRLENPPPVEVLVGSWDAPGSRLLDAVAVMDTLRSPGGCPWYAEQTHASLAPYLIEESYETLEAINERDSEHLADELGDVLYQVLFHSCVAAERGDEGFDIDDVAGGLVEKLIRRNEHVFGGEKLETAADVEARWSDIKSAEQPERDRDDPFDGIPEGMPPLERAVKMTTRAARRDKLDIIKQAAQGEDVGAALLDLVLQARELGVDPGMALAKVLSDVAAQSRTKSAN